ncbi:MAG: ATP-NAD kinase family protein [Candidatus Bathyarchaeia archaeon]
MQDGNKSPKRLGFIVNPIAGMGGSVGLKGTDGNSIVEKAIKLGAKPISPLKAKKFLEELKPIKNSISIYAYAGKMGEDEVKECEIEPSLVIGERKEKTTAEDTKLAAIAMKEQNVELIVFCGGDGTAKDIMDAINMSLPVLGIPAGVKMYSGVFAINPKKAAKIVVEFLSGRLGVKEAEVMDIDEEAFRKGIFKAKLYGYLLTPNEDYLIQQTKVSAFQIEEENENKIAIAKYIVEEMENDCFYIIGPGTTTKAINDLLGLKKTLLGVDVIFNKKLIVMDVNEEKLLELLKNGKKAKIIVTPIGGQGYVFGRGNQQLSPNVIKKIGKENIIIIATRQKLATLKHKRLLVDTGDEDLDNELKGFTRVVTGYREESILKIE